MALAHTLSSLCLFLNDFTEFAKTNLKVKVSIWWMTMKENYWGTGWVSAVLLRCGRHAEVTVSVPRGTISKRIDTKLKFSSGNFLISPYIYWHLLWMGTCIPRYTLSHKSMRAHTHIVCNDQNFPHEVLLFFFGFLLLLLFVLMQCFFTFTYFLQYVLCLQLG